MKLPFSIDNFYTTHLSKNQVIEELKSLTNQKKFGGFRTDEIISTISENSFIIQRNTYGVDFFTLERYPVVEGVFFSDRPLIINILIKPNYFIILFFAIFVFIFIPAGIFVDKMTINGVLRVPTILERFLFAGVGGIMPGLWCYFGYIRPIKKSEKWIVEKLSLSLTNYYSS